MNYGQDPYWVLTLMRIAMMLLATGAGFGLGWLLSPHAKGLRIKAGLIIAGVVGLVAIVSNTALGWSAAWLIAMVGFCAGLGYWLSGTVARLIEKPTTFGSSEWATAEELKEKKLFADKGIALGKSFDGEKESRLAYQGDRHILTVAPTRSGKGTAHIIPNLLTYEGSVLVIDPKGENALITAEARKAMGQRVKIIDPWGIAAGAGIEAACFNPLDWLQAGDVDLTENAMLLADALIMPLNEKDAFWDEEAKALLQGIILYVATDAREDGQRHLGRVRDLLLMDGQESRAMFEHMLSSPHHIVASTGARCLQKDPKLMANVLASAQAQTHFLDSARIRESLSRSDLKFEDLKIRAMSVYLVLPADRLHTFGRWLRLLVQQAITVNARNIETRPKKPVLFILDEMPTLGKLTMIEQAYGLMAGFGIQLWGIVQDLGQLKRVYGEGYESFIANSGAVAYFGSPDKMTAEYFSSLCGVTTVWNFSTALATALSISSGKDGGGSSRSTTNTDTRAASQRQLAYPDELMRLPRDRQLLLLEDTNPIMAIKARWFEDPALKAKGRDLSVSRKPQPKARMPLGADKSLELAWAISPHMPLKAKGRKSGPA